MFNGLGVHPTPLVLSIICRGNERTTMRVRGNTENGKTVMFPYAVWRRTRYPVA